MRVYISGPIKGMPGGNRNAFSTAEKVLRLLGYKVVNPQNLPVPEGGVDDYEGWMRTDIRALCDCDAIYMLKHWTKSKGAQLEYRIAKVLGMKRIDGIKEATHGA